MPRTAPLRLVLAAVSAFGLYVCMYAFRKPFTSATYGGLQWLGMDYKIWLVIAQTVGYTLSKFAGIRFMAELRPGARLKAVLLALGGAWAALLLFALLPAPWNILTIVLNGFGLGFIYGLVFSYLEGRRTTELLGAVLAASFIVAVGFSQSAGRYVLLEWAVDPFWMPFITGALFVPFTILFALLLNRTPPPSEEDEAQRTVRRPMTAEERKAFSSLFGPGLVLLVLIYVLTTVMRDYRSNFAADIWTELGRGGDVSVFTQTELPASLITLLLLGLLFLIRSNLRALLVNHYVVAAGFAVCLVLTLLFRSGAIAPFTWMAGLGVGLYLAYVPFNVMLFERLIAAFRQPGTAGFLIYLADSFAYLGSDAVLVAKTFFAEGVSWSAFFTTLILGCSSLALLLTLISAAYFRKRHRHLKPEG